MKLVRKSSKLSRASPSSFSETLPLLSSLQIPLRFDSENMHQHIPTNTNFPASWSPESFNSSSLPFYCVFFLQMEMICKPTLFSSIPKVHRALRLPLGCIGTFPSLTSPFPWKMKRLRGFFTLTALQWKASRLNSPSLRLRC